MPPIQCPVCKKGFTRFVAHLQKRHSYTWEEANGVYENLLEEIYR